MTIKFEHLPDILKGKVNTGKLAGKPFRPKLVDFMAEVSHAFADFTYIASSTDGYGDRECVYKVAVMSGNQTVGSLAVDRGYRRNDVTELYVVTSDAIENKRHREHNTKHLKLAMKTVKEYFKVKPVNERAVEMQGHLEYKLRRMTTHAEDAVTSPVRNSISEVVAFLASYNELDPKPAGLPNTLEAKLSKHWRDKLNDYRIASSVYTAFKTNQGVCVRIEVDGALATFDLASKEFVEHKSTYDLPTNYQEKISMLKLMDESQPVEHVGVWFEDSSHEHRVRIEHKYFFLVAGKTYTDC